MALFNEIDLESAAAIRLATGWAKEMLERTVSARREFLARHDVTGEMPIESCPTLKLGTDCAGAD